MTPHPNRSPATAGVGMNTGPTGRRAPVPPGAVWPKTSRKRGPAGRNRAAEVIDRVELKRAGEQEDPVAGGAAVQIGEPDRVEVTSPKNSRRRVRWPVRQQ
jgi:hypothetical protein